MTNPVETIELTSEPRTLPDIFFSTVSRWASVLAIHAPHRQPPEKYTYQELAEQVECFGAGLLSLGIAPGDRVALLADNRPRWLISDLALVCTGAISVPRSSDTTVPEIWYIVNHSEAKAAILQDRRLYERIAHDISLAPSLQFLVMMDDSANALERAGGITVYNFSDVVERGRDQRDKFHTARQQVTPDQIAAIVYTSGTTGIPKGVPLRHRNLSYQCDIIDLGFQIHPGDVLLSILPAWHVYERVAEYFGMRHGVTIYYTDKRWLREDMTAANPAFLPCVPRIWESVYDGIMGKIRAESPIKRRLIEQLLAKSREYVRAKRLVTGRVCSSTPPPVASRLVALGKVVLLCLPHIFADILLYRKVRKLTGTKLKAAVSGGGSLAAYLDDFFEAVGIPILNGYGLTETSPVLAVRTLKENVRGTVGKPLPNTEIEIRDEDGKPLPQGQVGVIYARGPQVMDGYFRNEEETRKVLSEDGWLNTGDLGWFTWNGHLVVSGRAKDTIVLSSGENVEPEKIETVARKSPLVSQIVVVGQDRKTLGALVVPDFAQLAVHLGLPQDVPPEDLVSHPNASRLVRDEINKMLSEDGGFRAFEMINKVTLLVEPFTDANGLLTQTLKPKRNVIMSRYANVIEAMYQSDGASQV